MSTLASPSTPSRPKSMDEPRLSQTIEELTTAPSSMVLNGYTLTSAPRVAFAPTCTSSPITTPSSTRTFARRFTLLPDDGPAEPATRRHVHAVVEDAAVDVDVGQDPAVGAEHRVGAEPRARLDGAVGPDHRRADGLDVRGDLGPLPHPHPVRHLEAGDVHVDHLVEDVLVGAEVGVHRAHVLPVAMGHRAVERPAVLQELREDVGREVDWSAGLDEVQDLRLQHVDAGVDGVAEDLAPCRLLEEALDRAVVAGDDDAEVQRPVDRGQPDRRHRLTGDVEVDDVRQVDVGDHVARHDDEALLRAARPRSAPSPPSRAGWARRRR